MPWVIIPDSRIADQFRIPKATFFDIISMGVIFFAVRDGLRRVYSNKYFSWLILWVFISFGINFFIPYSFSFGGNQRVNGWAFDPMLHILLAIPAMLCILSTLDREDYSRLADAICTSSVIVTVVSLLQVIGFDIFGTLAKYPFITQKYKFCAFMDNPDNVGYYLALSAPFFLRYRFPKNVLLGLILIGIVFSGSELAIGVVAVGIVAYLSLFLNSKYKYVPIIICALVAIIGIIASFYSVDILTKYGGGRIDAWKQAVEVLRNNPVFGQGVGVFKNLAVKTGSSVWQEVHNDWLERTIELGFVGLFSMSFVVFNSIRRFGYRNNDVVGNAYFASFIAYLFLMFGFFAMSYPPLALFGLINFCAVETL